MIKSRRTEDDPRATRVRSPSVFHLRVRKARDEESRYDAALRSKMTRRGPPEAAATDISTLFTAASHLTQKACEPRRGSQHLQRFIIPASATRLLYERAPRGLRSRKRLGRPAEG